MQRAKSQSAREGAERERMSGSLTVEVETFTPEGVVSVRVCPPWRGGSVKAAVGEKLGLKSSSLQLFSLFDGPLEAPVRSTLSNSELALPSRNYIDTITAIYMVIASFLHSM